MALSSSRLLLLRRALPHNSSISSSAAAACNGPRDATHKLRTNLRFLISAALDVRGSAAATTTTTNPTQLLLLHCCRRRAAHAEYLPTEYRRRCFSGETSSLMRKRTAAEEQEEEQEEGNDVLAVTEESIEEKQRTRRRLVLYSKPGCCLCDALKEKLHLVFMMAGEEGSMSDIVELEVRDITTNKEWEQAYQYEIPVLALLQEDNSEAVLPRSSPRLTIEQLRKKLAAALN